MQAVYSGNRLRWGARTLNLGMTCGDLREMSENRMWKMGLLVEWIGCSWSNRWRRMAVQRWLFLPKGEEWRDERARPALLISAAALAVVSADFSPPAKSPSRHSHLVPRLSFSRTDTLKDSLNLLCTTTEKRGERTPRLHFLHALYLRAEDE